MPSYEQSPQLHASAVAIDGRGVLLLGPSGAGKSDLALRLIDRGARLIADDRVDLAANGRQIILSAPKKIAGLIEVRGIGIVRSSFCTAPLTLAVELVPPEMIDRLPEPDAEIFGGQRFTLVRVTPFEPSAPIKVEIALKRVRAGARR